MGIVPFSVCKGFSFEKSAVPNYPWKFHREAKIAKFGIETVVKQNVGSGCRTVSNETWIDKKYREVMYIRFDVLVVYRPIPKLNAWFMAA